MSARGGRARVVLVMLLAASAPAMVGCGGETRPSDGDASAQAARERVAEVRAYATAVQRVTEKARKELTKISDVATYEDGTASAKTTQRYARVITGAADQLAPLEAQAPAAARASHVALVKLYRDTAANLKGLERRFSKVGQDADLFELAQELSSQIQGYSTQEATLRSQIEQVVVQATSPPVTGSSAAPR